MQDAKLINNIVNSSTNYYNEESLMDITIDSYSETSSEDVVERISIFNPLCNIFTNNIPVKSILKKDIEKEQEQQINKKIYNKIVKFCCGIMIIISCVIIFTVCIIII